MAVVIKQGSVITKKIIITNKENRKLKIKIYVDNWENLVALHEYSSFILNPRESKEIFLDFIARENQASGNYISKIIIESEGYKKEVLFSIGTSSQEFARYCCQWF